MAEVSLARWQPHLEAADQAGLSIAAYARQNNLSPHSLYMARKELRERGQSSTPAASPQATDRFVGVKLTTPPLLQSAAVPVEIHVSERVFLRCSQLPDPVWLVALVRTLEQRS